MPVSNRFRHQHYDGGEPTSPYRQLVAPPQPALGSDAFLCRMRDAATACRAAGVTHIVLIHGTFAGDDYFDLAPLVECWSPAWADRLRDANKRVTDRLLRDAGNFIDSYAALLFTALNAPGQQRIDVQRFFWSGGNTHQARAIAAIRLFRQLAALAPPAPPRTEAPGAPAVASPTRRILCLGHSHGGNAMAVLTNLLAAEPADRRRFLDVVRPALPRPGRPGPWLCAWQQALDRLACDAVGRDLLAGCELDLVTLGTPIRYGWEAGGYSRLLHFVSHRPSRGLPKWRTRLPGSVDDALAARCGDLVQQLGVAGTNFPLLALRWRRWRAERKLAALLQAGVPSRQFAQRILLGQRVPDEGTTLLIDYGVAPRRGRLREIFGHGRYTHLAWLPFHFDQIAREFYGLH